MHRAAYLDDDDDDEAFQHRPRGGDAARREAMDQMDRSYEQDVDDHGDEGASNYRRRERDRSRSRSRRDDDNEPGFHQHQRLPQRRGNSFRDYHGHRDDHSRRDEDDQDDRRRSSNHASSWAAESRGHGRTSGRGRGRGAVQQSAQQSSLRAVRVQMGKVKRDRFDQPVANGQLEPDMSEQFYTIKVPCVTNADGRISFSLGSIRHAMVDPAAEPVYAAGVAMTDVVMSQIRIANPDGFLTRDQSNGAVLFANSTGQLRLLFTVAAHEQDGLPRAPPPSRAAAQAAPSPADAPAVARAPVRAAPEPPPRAPERAAHEPPPRAPAQAVTEPLPRAPDQDVSFIVLPRAHNFF